MVNHNLRVQSLTKAETDTSRLALLQQDVAAGDQALGDILRSEGTPDKIEVERTNPTASAFALWHVELRMHYSTSRKLYVFQGGENLPWQLVRTGIASSLPLYRPRDTIVGYREYLKRFPDDPPEDVSWANARLADLIQEERKREAVEHMAEFVRKQAKPESIDAYEAWLRKTPADDPSRLVAVEKRDSLRFEGYKAKGTRAALREFAEKYPESSIARRLRAEYILDDSAAAAIARAAEALDDLRTALTVGVNFQEYGRRLVDSKIAVTRALSDPGARAAAVASNDLEAAVGYYQQALEVWNWEIQNISARCDSGRGCYSWWGEPAVAGWLGACPQALERQPVGNPPWLNGLWWPDRARQCFWNEAGGRLEKVKRQLAVP
jgi:hypothetical protein